jgi:hypothetical protein
MLFAHISEFRFGTTQWIVASPPLSRGRFARSARALHGQLAQLGGNLFVPRRAGHLAAAAGMDQKAFGDCVRIFDMVAEIAATGHCSLD